MILDTVSLLILGVIWGASLNSKGRSLLARYHWGVFTVSVSTLFAYAAYLGVLLYKATYEHPIGRFFDIEYVLVFRIGAGIFAPYLVSLVLALLFMWVATKYNGKYDERFFEKEEIRMGGLSLLLVGHPGWMAYLTGIIFVYLLIHIYYRLRYKSGERLPVYHLWVPAAVFVILISKYWLSSLPFWKLLAI